MDGNDRIRLRNAAAGLIKSLIRARCRQEPDFLSAADRQRWGIADVVAEDRPCAQLLTRVRQLRSRFELDFLQGQDSIPAPDSVEQAEAIDNLIDQVASFIYGELDEAIGRAARSEQVRWEELADWSRLAALRDALDRLPEADVGDTEVAAEDQDGPFPPDGLVYGGQPYEIPAGLVYRLIDALWHAPKWTLAYEDLAEPVWRDHAKDVTVGMVGSLRSRANHAFKEQGVSLRIKAPTRYVCLVRT